MVSLLELDEELMPKLNDEDDGGTHVICPCKPDVSFCGKPMDDVAWASELSRTLRDCALCVLLEESFGCPYCAEPPWTEET